MNQEPNFTRLKALFALKRLSTPLRSEVLADGSIANKYGLEATHPIPLSDEIVLRRNELFAAFQQAADGGPKLPLNNERNGPLDATVKIEADGSGSVSVNKKRWLFPFAVLLSSELERRLGGLEQLLLQHTFSHSNRIKLDEIVRRPQFSIEDFFAVLDSVALSPETFAESLNSKLQNGSVAIADLLPQNDDYWNNITTSEVRSKNLANYIDEELFEEWSLRLSDNADQAFRSISLTFSSPALVPRPLLTALDKNVIGGLIKHSCDYVDPFALTGSFQICADLLDQGTQFSELGEIVLDKLFGDMDRLETECQIFCAAFVVSTAFLAEHEALRLRPPFWRRIAAAAHASLVLRTSGVTDAKQDDLVGWAFGNAGAAFFLSVYNDFASEPRWRPEWLRAPFLIADVYGRVANTVHSLPDGVAPENWKKRLEKAEAEIIGRDIQHLVIFPAVSEGERPKDSLDLEKFEAFAELYRDFKDETSAENFLRLSLAIYILGVPDRIQREIIKVFEEIRVDVDRIDNNRLENIITIGAHIAAQINDVEIADHVANFCLERARTAHTVEEVAYLFYRLVECSSAIPDRDSAFKTLAKRLETFAFLIPTSELLAELIDLLKNLKRIAPEIVPLLGRAIAAAKMGADR